MHTWLHIELSDVMLTLLGLEAFFPLPVKHHRAMRREKSPKFWLWNYSYYPMIEGEVGCDVVW